MELLNCGYRLWHHTGKWLLYAKMTHFQPLFTTQDECAIGNYILKMGGHSDFGRCGCRKGIQLLCITLSESNMTFVMTHSVLSKLWLNGGSTEERVIFRTEVRFTDVVQILRQSNSNNGNASHSATILDLFWKGRQFGKCEKATDNYPQDKTSDMIQHQAAFLMHVYNEYFAKH